MPTRAARLADGAGAVAKQPPTWAATAGAMALWGGPQGRRAATRAVTCYGAAAIVANLVLKPMVHRRRPPAARHRKHPPLTSSWPSGHAASGVAFMMGSRQELPSSFPWLFSLATAAHWSILRRRSHYVGDVLAGELVGAAVAVAVERLWPHFRA